MIDRETSLRDFLNDSPFRDAQRAPLAGDASARRYERLRLPNGDRAVLMDADPNRGESTDAFIKIAQHLRSNGLSAPQIMVADQENGFLILEDLGDDLFARICSGVPDLERAAYEAAVDVLAALHRVPVPQDLTRYRVTMPGLGALAYEWYRRGAGIVPDPQRTTMFQDELAACLNRLAADDNVLILRDYHAENLLWLPDRHGPARVGLLDFQDAMVGHRAYDLVSLLEDARRDVDHDLAAHLMARYIAATGQDDARFRASAAAVAAQRNLRILGVFARLNMRDHKPRYIDFIPRVWRHLMHDLSHPELARLRDIVMADLPEPTPDILAKLRAA